MHLKNFSIIENVFGEYELSPAYDLINTAIVMLDDKEETALTINGKKSKLTLKDFQVLATSLNIEFKSFEKILKRFENVIPLWINSIENSFLSDAGKEQYISIIKKRSEKVLSTKQLFS
jgi:serine/threonine-protein kinase HipA